MSTRTNLDELVKKANAEIAKMNQLQPVARMFVDSEAVAGPEEELKYILNDKRDDILDRRRLNYFLKKTDCLTPLTDEEWSHVKDQQMNSAVEASVRGLPDKQ